MPLGLRGLSAGLLFTFALAGCASQRPPPLAARDQAAYAPSPQPRYAGPGVSSLANLPGWAEEDHAAALAAFQAGCGVSTDPALRAVCSRARAAGPLDEAGARSFLEANFRPVILSGPGVLTGYFAPVYPARAAPDDTFTAALRPRPSDMVVAAPDPDAPGRKPVVLQRGEDGRTWPYPDRAGIELTPADDALAYLKPEDLFFLQIQGSGVLLFPDGRRLKASYAADNGRPFVAIASTMARRGLLGADRVSANGIRAWLHAHAGPQAQSLMDLDPRYVFFNVAPDDGREPAGAAGVPLTAGRAVAVDPAFHGYGELYWIDAAAPMLKGAVKSYRRLVMALDTGSAIRGAVRADLYMGRGDEAGLEAGRIRHTLLMVRLVPVATPTYAAPGYAREAAAPAR